MNYMKCNKVIIIFFSWCLPFSVQALSSDREKPMYCSADSVVIDQNSDISILTGSVKVTQGSVEVLGDVITIYTKDKKVVKLVSVGNKKQQAYYTEEEDHGKGLVKAWADTISYQTDPDIVKLENNVKITRPDEVFTGKFIQYDKQKQRIDAHGDPKHMKQVEIVLQPKPKNSQPSPKKK